MWTHAISYKTVDTLLIIKFDSCVCPKCLSCAGAEEVLK